MERNYTEERLVSFGNYLLGKYGVMKTDESGSPMYQRQVSHADVCNWEDFRPLVSDEYQEIHLPQHLPVGTKAFIGFHGKEPMNVTIKGVHFYGDYHSNKNKVKYDLELKFAFEPATRMYNIDSDFIFESAE